MPSVGFKDEPSIKEYALAEPILIKKDEAAIPFSDVEEHRREWESDDDDWSGPTIVDYQRAGRWRSTAEMAASEEGSRMRELLRAVRFYIVPVANPDGYVWTWTGPINRMLRKNRRPDPLGVGGLCDGVDLNR